MKNNKLQKGIASLALLGSFIFTVAAFGNANAQDWRWERQRRAEQQRRNGAYGPVDQNGNIDRNQNGIDDRYEAYGQVDRNQNGVPDNEEGYQENYGYGRNRGYYGNNRGNYGNDGYSENRGYGNNNYEFQQGYRDGLDRGQEDVEDGRRANPNNSQHYRQGTAAYRQGFAQGYREGYRQYSNRSW